MKKSIVKYVNICDIKQNKEISRGFPQALIGLIWFRFFFYSGNGAKRRYRFSLPSVCGEVGRKVEVHHERFLLF